MRRLWLLPVLVVAAVCAVAGVRAASYAGKANPGVHLLGVDLGGKSPNDVAAAVGRAGARWLAAPVDVVAPQRHAQVRRGDLLALDVRATTDSVMRAGSAFELGSTDVQPVLRPAAGADGYLHAVASLGRAPVPARVRLAGTTPVVTSARDGLALDRAALLAAVARGDPRVSALFVSDPAAIRDPAARSAAATARTLLDAPVRLVFHGARLGALAPWQLARALRIAPRAHRFAVRFDAERLAEAVRPRLGRWIRRARNARFAVAGARVRILPSAPGRDVDAAGLAVAVTAAARNGHVARIELTARDSDLTTAEAKALGIRRRLVSFTTAMGASSSNRIHNVHLMADLIDGTIIRPGATFSFNKVVGPRTAGRGFLEGQEIIGSLVLPSIGGGVCQTATTLFNDAFDNGLPVLARTNHNLYLSHYPLGRDATVAWGGPDLVFRNDMKHGILIKAAYTDATLTFMFYGTPQGRRVVAETGPETNFKSATTTYAVDPSAPRDSVQVVSGSGQQGFDVSVRRTVYERGKVLRRDTFRSRYIPEGPTAVYGPGRTPPGPYFVVPPH